MTDISIKRVYAPVAPSDGYRIYIDRLWPRGLSHETFKCDRWDKDIAPSTELREWFHADPENRWEEFAHRYAEELKANPDLKSLRECVTRHDKITLLYSSHDERKNNAVVLMNILQQS